jgi:hypothetical protein
VGRACSATRQQPHLPAMGHKCRIGFHIKNEVEQVVPPMPDALCDPYPRRRSRDTGYPPACGHSVDPYTHSMPSVRGSQRLSSGI